MEREPQALESLREFLFSASGRYPSYDNSLETLEFGGLAEHNARNAIERLAISAQAAVLINADNPVAEAFCKLRFDQPGYLFGASGAVVFSLDFHSNSTGDLQIGEEGVKFNTDIHATFTNVTSMTFFFK